MGAPYRIVWATKSFDELKELHAYIAQDSQDSAGDTVRRLLDAMSDLALFPNRQKIARQSAEGKPPVRSFPVGLYIIYFRVFERDHGIRIVDLRHGARRQPKRFS